MYILFLTVILLSEVAGRYSKVVYSNPNNQKVLSVTKGEEFVVSWNLDVKEKGYLNSRMILRHKTHSTNICKFDNKNFFIYNSTYQGNIMDIQRTQIKLVSTSFELDEVLFSIENSYKVNETATNVEVYDYIPIFVIAKPHISCQNNQRFVDNTLIIECNVRSKPEADINVGFQMMHSGFNTTKETQVDSGGFSNINVQISFPLNVYYLNKMLFVSASVGKYHEMINVTISSKLPPFNVKLYVDEDNSPEQNISIYSSDRSKIVVRCSADSFSSQIQYTIKAPNKKTFNDEQFVIDRFDDSIHAGSWECSAKNEYGTVKSQSIVVKILEEKPSIPVIKINHLINSTNTFCVDFLDVITVTCMVIHSKPFDDNTIRYSLQMINSGSKYNKTSNNHGTFEIAFDESYNENIYACRGENDVGVGSPAIFYLYKNKVLESSPINFMKTIDVHSTYMGTMCFLTSLLVVFVVILIVKLRHRTNRVLLCGACYSFARNSKPGHSMSSDVLSQNLETSTEENKALADSFEMDDQLKLESKHDEEIDDNFTQPISTSNDLHGNTDETAHLL